MEKQNIEGEIMNKAMLALGWDPTADIPMANEENRIIFKTLEELIDERAQLQETLDQTAERAEKLHKHSKNAEGDINHNLKLLNAFQNQLRSESHLFRLAQREHSKLKQDIKEREKENVTFKQYVEKTETELCKRQHHINDMMNRIKWSKTMLIEWQQAMEDSHKGSQLLERYFKEDELKARQEDNRRKILLIEIEKQRTELAELCDQQRTLEQNLECTATMYRAAHAERRQMVDMWKTAVSQMLQREHDIQQSEMMLNDLAREAKVRANEQRRKDNQLNEIIENNRLVEAAIEELNSSTSDIKEQIQKLKDMIILKENEVEILQKELQNLGNHVQQQRRENRQTEKERKAKLEQLKAFEAVEARLKQSLKDMVQKGMNAQERLQMLENMNDTEQKTQNDINNETTQINTLIFRAQQQLTKLKDDEKTLEVNNDGILVAIQAILNNKQKTEKELCRQTQMHYSMAFKCLQIERRIAKIQGGLVDPEVEQRNEQLLTNLEDQYAAAQKRLQVTEAENKKLDDNMRQITTVYNFDVTVLEEINFKVHQAQSYCEGGLANLKAHKYQNQVLIVELSLLKMRVNDFEKAIAECESSTYNLEKHRSHLNRTIKDRMVEIKSQTELLQMKRKHLNEEKSTLRADIGERKMHIDAVRARFELTSQLLGVNEDGTLVTATQLKVEMAQEKQMLLEEGDQLNMTVLKAEEEIHAMENTLFMLHRSNDRYRKRCQPMEDGDEAQTEFCCLRENHWMALNHLKQLRSKVLSIGNEIERANEQKEMLELQLEDERQKRQENTNLLSKMQKELAEQKAKMQRAERDIKSILKKFKQDVFTPEFMALYERELDLRELEYRNSKAINQLSELADSNDIIGPRIIGLLADKDIKKQHLLQKAQSFVSWRSDVSSVSSKVTDLSNSTYRSSVTESTQHEKSLTARVSVLTLNFAND